MVMKLGEVAKVISGYAFKSSCFCGLGIPVIKIKNIQQGSIDLTDMQCVDRKFLSIDNKYHVKHGDLLISLTGSHLTQPNSVVGRVALYKDSARFCLLNQRAGKIIITKPSNCNNVFLYYYLFTEESRQKIANMAHGAANQANVSPSQIEGLELDLPQINTQRKIASILSAYDDLIENNTRRIKILEEMAQRIYREWFVNFRFPGHEKVKMVESELGMIPEGWGVKKLSELVNTQYGYTESAKEEPIGPKYVRGTDINKTSYIDWAFVPYCPISESDYPKYKVLIGDIFIIRMADPGKVGIVEKEIDAVFASYLIRLIIKTAELSPYYLFYFLLSERYQNYVTGACTGTTRKSASAGVITDITILIPQLKIREIFEQQIFNIRKLLNNLLARNSNLRKTRDLLLTKLISGQLDVSDLDIDTGVLDA